MIKSLPAADGVVHLETDGPSVSIAVEDFLQAATKMYAAETVADAMRRLFVYMHEQGVRVDLLSDFAGGDGRRRVIVRLR